MGDPEQQTMVVLDGIVDALGVIVGLTRLHLPAEHSTAAALSHARSNEPQSLSLCGLTTGQIVAREGVDTELPMCVICMNVAANLILTAEHIGGRIKTRHTSFTAPTACTLQPRSSGKDSDPQPSP